jgi:uncharacterized protein YcnI
MTRTRMTTVNRAALATATSTLLCLFAGSASAHVSLASGPGFADATQEITFGVGHGCAGADTLSVRVEIPAAITSVRAVHSTLGPAKVEKDAAGLVKAVTWSKPAADLQDGDPNYYKLTLRLKVPNQPFTTLAFPATQTCRTTAGVETVVAWVGGSAAAPDASAPDAGAPEPAPTLVILPARQPGWNKYQVAADVTDLAGYFGDAQIVWVGTAAFSPNGETAALIKTEPNTTALTTIPVGSTVWVRY